MQRAVLILALAALCSPALAQRTRAQPAPPAPAVTPPEAPSTPADAQRTTATFGDWVMRCVRPDRGQIACDVAQFLTDKGQPVAQTSFTRTRAGEPMRLTVLVPVNVLLTLPPKLAGSDAEAGFAPIFLTWRRCIPQGCVADATLTDEQLRRLRARTDNARVLFQDSTGRDAALPFGPRGLSQALDALAKES